MDELKEIISHVQAASREIDCASQQAKAVPTLLAEHQELESIWADIDVLFKKLTTMEGARRE